jgi:hypothetical protein
MILNRIGIVIYRVALIAAISFVGFSIHKLVPELRHLSVQIDGDVSASISSSSALDVNVAPIDFAKNAFVGSGSLDVSSGTVDVNILK